jgi:hypothetical protein
MLPRSLQSLTLKNRYVKQWILPFDIPNVVC